MKQYVIEKDGIVYGNFGTVAGAKRAALKFFGAWNCLEGSTGHYSCYSHSKNSKETFVCVIRPYETGDKPERIIK